MADFGRPPSVRVNFAVPRGDLPRWLGEALLEIDALPNVHLGLERVAVAPDAGLRAPDRWWRSRIALLQPWRPAGAARSRLTAWEASGLSAASVTLSLVDDASGPAWVGGVGPAARITLTGAGGRSLGGAFPLVESITSGSGIRLESWQRDAVGAPRVYAHLHIAASPRYSLAIAALAPALRRLVERVLAEARTAPLGGRATAPGAWSLPASTGTVRAGRAGDPALWHGLRGRARAWVERQRSLWLSEHWRVGVIDAPLAQCALPGALPPVKWITPRARDGYWADPFGVPGEPRQLACERFDERSGVGQIDVLRFDADDALVGRTRLPLGAGRHVSFPNLFVLAGRRLGLPETAAARVCVVHELDAGGAWRPLATVLDGVAAADPALFEFDGRCWIAYTDLALGTQDNLCLQHAPRLEGPWEPHALNPVKVDIGAARMAGNPFWHAGALYRPAQDCLRTYGAAVVVHRIEVLTPERFVEVAVRRIEPDAHGACPDGLHTLSAWGGRTLIDGKRMVVNPRVLARKLARRLPAALRMRSAG